MCCATVPKRTSGHQGGDRGDDRVEPRMGASLLRLHFHDCFVNGCDGSILLDDTLGSPERRTRLRIRTRRGDSRWSIESKMRLTTPAAATSSHAQTSSRLRLVTRNPEAFAKDFGESMIRMGALTPLTGSAGEIRLNCRRSFTFFALISAIFFPAFAQLTSDFYDSICPQALSTIQVTVEAAIMQEPRMGASLVRLHFHDCFVNGCDGSILLDDTPAMTGEKTAKPNKNSARGFDVVDQIKSAVNDACLGNVVSCADILAVAARDSIVALGGASYDVLLGRRDATDASLAAANANIPAPTLDLAGLISNFQSQGLSLSDLVVLSGAHTLGFARCVSFRNRIYNETANINSDFAASLQAQCPPDAGDGDDVLASLDDTPFVVDTDYYQGLLQNQGLLHSDQQLFQGDGSDSDNLVQFYSQSPTDFWSDFGTAMINMGNLSPLTGDDGEIRENCRVVNQD
uniref:peroxidase n=1 Tax=Ananas comosus var. bracteatus TaxID=296719 RepID=A0A6V7PQX1_ANACO|nr:unnamed protein product [Ananas comosus var. bracteatus]